MKAKLPHPEHYSYVQHRKQRFAQVILPVVLCVLIFIGMIVWVSLAAFNAGGDVGRWAAISTMWIVIPIIVTGVIVLAILIGLIYLMALALGALPYYTGLTQDYVYKAQAYITHAADRAAKPIIAIGGVIANIRAFFERIGNP